MAKRYWALLIAILLWIVFVSFVHDRDAISRGWSVFCVLLAAGSLITIQGEMKNSWHGRLAIVVGLCIALSHALYAQEHLTPLNVLIAPLAIIYGAWVLHFGSGRVEGTIKSYVRDFGRIFVSIGGVYKYVHSLFSRDTASVSKSKMRNNIVSGVILAIIVLALLIPLLSSADPIFAQMFSGVVQPLNEFYAWLESSDIRLDKIIVFLIVAAVTLSIMVFFRSGRAAKEVKGISRSMERSIFNIMTRSVAVVYVLFAFIQIKYLLLGAALPEGITYSEYAVSGFRQLIGISFINIALMLLAPHYRKGESKGLYMVLLRVVFLASMVILASSLFRLNLYIEAYGLTFMRILPLTFIVYLAYGLIVSFAGIFYHHMQRSNLLAYGLVVRYAAFQLLGVDAIVANYNIKRYITGATNLIDVEYLTRDLSYDQLKAEYNLDDLREYLTSKQEITETIEQIDKYKEGIQQ